MKRLFMILIVLLALGNVGLLVRSWWTNLQWEQAMFGVATYAGAMQADADFRNGVLRFYELTPDTKAEDTHRKDGPFEVWTRTYYPNLGHAHEFAEQRFVEMYNEKMRYMHAHPERFDPNGDSAHVDTTQPSDQPISRQP
jgi:hypothetical protein